MKLAVLSYAHPSDLSQNFGDEVQSIAAARLLPRVDLKIPRIQLRSFPLQEPCLLIMNGFFRAMPGQFPPSEHITPLYISFFIEQGSEWFYKKKECIDHFKRHEPIGCRSRHTMRLLQDAGVDAYYSKCLTMTFPRRNVQGADQLLVVDLLGPRLFGVTDRVRSYFGVPLSKAKIKRVTALQQYHGLDIVGDETRTLVAQAMLDTYRRKAQLVMTTRLHCSLPCIAMGIPVIFFADKFDHRTEILQELGVVRQPKIKVIILEGRRMGRIEAIQDRLMSRIEAIRRRNLSLAVSAIDIEEDKKILIDDFKSRVEALVPGIQLADTAELLRDSD